MDDCPEENYYEFLNETNEKITDYAWNNSDILRIPRKNYPRLVTKVNRLAEFTKLFKSELNGIDVDYRENGDMYECELNYNYGDYRINYEFESSGIKKLRTIFNAFDAAASGRIVFADEIDANINNIYLNKLVEYLALYGKGQMCFTCHSLEPMETLRHGKNSINFLTSEPEIVQWAKHGNATPQSDYRNGLIRNIPLNIESFDFLGILGEAEEDE